MSKELVTIEEISEANAPTIYVKDGLKRFLDMTRAQVEGEVPDLSTRKGRDRIASLAATVSKSKAAVEKPGRDYLRRLKAMPKTIEEELRIFVTEMDALRDKVRQPLNDWQKAEDDRVDRHNDAIGWFTQLSTETEELDGAELQSRISMAEGQVIDQAYEEFEADAHREKARVLESLKKALAKRVEYEAAQAELTRMIEEKAARDEQDRIKAAQQQAVEEERQRAAQEQQAQREADAHRVAQAEQAREQARKDLELAEERRLQADRDRIAADKRAEDNRIAAEKAAQHEREQADIRQKNAEEFARQQEQQRQQDEKDREQRQKAVREADKAHRGLINKAALDALLTVNMSAPGQPESFMSVIEAQAIIVAIVRGQIPAISIAY